MTITQEILLYLFVWLLLVQALLLVFEKTHKRLNNKYLAILFFGSLFFNWYVLVSFPDLAQNFSTNLLRSFAMIGVFFALTLTGSWSVGNFKYVSILLLYLTPFGSPLTGVANMFFIILMYVLGEIFLFYIRMVFFIKGFFALWVNHTWKNVKDFFGKGGSHVLATFIAFLSLFALLRVVRTAISAEYYHFFSRASIEYVFLFYAIMLGMSRLIFRSYYTYIEKNLFLVWGVFFALIGYFTYFLWIDFDHEWPMLRYMFGYGLLIYVSMQTIHRLYNFALDTDDSRIISYSQLKPGHYIDKKFLASVLANYRPKKEVLTSFLSSVQNPLDREMVRSIKLFFGQMIRNRSKIYRETDPCKHIKIYTPRHFPVSLCLTIGFYLTILFNQNLPVIFLREIIYFVVGRPE